MIVFRKEIWHILRHPFSREGLNLIIATIPTCLIALIALPIAKISFEGKFLGISFLISAILLFFAEKKKILVLCSKTNFHKRGTFYGYCARAGNLSWHFTLRRNDKRRSVFWRRQKRVGKVFIYHVSSYHRFVADYGNFWDFAVKCVNFSFATRSFACLYHSLRCRYFVNQIDGKADIKLKLKIFQRLSCFDRNCIIHHFIEGEVWSFIKSRSQKV